MENSYTFDGELYFETIKIGDKKVEHVGFKSYDGSFENLLYHLPETIQLPQKATITIQIKSDYLK